MTIRRLLSAWGLLALLALQGAAMAQAPAPASAASAPPLATTMTDRAKRAMLWADWRELERLDALALADTQRGDDGGLAYCRVMRGISQKFNSESLEYHEARVAGTLAWAQQQPDLPLAHAVHLKTLVELAWFHRGGGYANTVSEQRYADYRAVIDRALAYANAHAALLANDAHTAEVMSNVMRSRDASVEQQLATLRRGLRGEPFDECLYRAGINGLMPKWGGRPQQLDAWIREATEKLPPEEAAIRYARLYSDAAELQYEQTLFESTAAQWPRMRDGLRSLATRFPKDPYWRNRRAYFACMAKDRDEAVQALQAVDKPDNSAWAHNPQREAQACRKWALQS